MTPLPALAAALALTACSAVVPATVAQLSRIDPMTADPADFAVALDLPAGIAPLPGGASLTLSAQSGPDSLTEQLVLAPVAAPAGLTPSSGGRILAFALPQAEAARLRAAQATIAAWRTDGRRGSVALGVGLAACATGAGLAPDALGAAWLRPAPGAAFLPLLRPAPLSDLTGGAAGGLPPCADPAG